MSRYPHAHATLLNALDEYLHPPEIIIVRGAGPEALEWSGTLTAAFNPRRLVFVVPADAADLPAALASKAARPGVVAYVCKGTACGPPVTRLAELVRNALSR
jgi:uncharacterized protein YyaL (SSP411 family)